MTARQRMVAELQAEALGFRSAGHAAKWAWNAAYNADGRRRAADRARRAGGGGVTRIPPIGANLENARKGGW